LAINGLGPALGPPKKPRGLILWQEFFHPRVKRRDLGIGQLANPLVRGAAVEEEIGVREYLAGIGLGVLDRLGFD